MLSAPLDDHRVRRSGFADTGRLRSALRVLQARGKPDILALRPARPDDGEALQSYVRQLSPESRYNRFLGGVSELPPSELAQAIDANGRDRLSLLLVSTSGERESIVGEARAAFFCAERGGEFSFSIADAWQGLGLGSALLAFIEDTAAADGIERLVGDVLRTNEKMIAFARAHGFGFGPGLEGRLVRIEKRLAAAPDLPCRKWTEPAGGAALQAA